MDSPALPPSLLHPSRLRRLGAVAGLALLCTLPACAPGPAARADYLYGADVSAVAVFEDNGTVYRDAEGAPGDALALLAQAGMNVFRLRLFVDPEPRGIVTNDLAYTLALARRVKASGAALLLNLHYSDTWADPGKQFKPKAWEALSFGDLLSQVENYTFAVMARFVAEGVAPEYVQLGNEITNGLLWPDGRVEYAEKDDTAAWDRLAALQLAADRGFRRAFPEASSRPARILHLESTGNLPRTEWYLASAAARGVEFDLLGFSYYPEWHGSLADLKATLDHAATLTGKPVLVVEVAYPWKDDAHWKEVPNLVFPLTPEGQAEFLRAVDALVREVPGGLGRGVIWWHPESVLNPHLNVWLGGSCALFDDEGRLLPAAASLKP